MNSKEFKFDYTNPLPYAEQLTLHRKKVIVNWFHNYGATRATIKEIAEGLEGETYHSLFKTIKRMEKDGELARSVNKGVNGADLYFLTGNVTPEVLEDNSAATGMQYLLQIPNQYDAPQACSIFEMAEGAPVADVLNPVRALPVILRTLYASLAAAEAERPEQIKQLNRAALNNIDALILLVVRLENNLQTIRRLAQLSFPQDEENALKRFAGLPEHQKQAARNWRTSAGGTE